MSSTRKIRRAPGFALAIVGVALLAVAGCGNNSNGGSGDAGTSKGGGTAKALEPITLILNGPAAGSSAGFMYAKELGLYREAGLDVKIDESAGSAVAANALAAGKYDFAFSNAPTQMLAAAKGANTRMVSVIHQNNGYAIISLTSSNIRTIQDLRGKTVGSSPGTATTSIFNAAMGVNGLEGAAKIVNVDPSALDAALLKKRVDAILGAAVADSINMRATGAEISDLLFSDIGVPTIGLAIATSDEMIKDHPDTVRKFVKASLEGWGKMRSDYKAAAAAVFKEFPAGTNEKTLETQSKAVVDVSLCSKDAVNLGRPSQALLDTSFDLLTKYQGLPKSPDVNSYFDWSFIPADAPTC